MHDKPKQNGEGKMLFIRRNGVGVGYMPKFLK